MQTFKQIVKSASGLLLAHPIGQQAHVKHLWNNIEFQINSERKTENDASLHPSKDLIALYPALLEKAPAQADTIVLREFGLLLLRKAGAHCQERWEKKLLVPRESQIAAVQGRLQDAAIRAANRYYRDVVETFTTAMDRLVCLNIGNALLANGVEFPSSQGIDIKVYGATSEYSCGKKYHSIIPLTSAYAPREVHNCYGCAFAEMIINKMRSIRETSTAKALESLIREIAEQAK
jgi:hypothetical protein